ncbi:MAG: 50S ribosomal protein L6 [Dehalococcoidia bacterium]|jgi:large subunit ribosomal protein L6|nr:MAG: large subunit ribosomal protein L6 [Chloroflexota bacterium]
MSRIGLQPINVPENVKVDVQGSKIVVTGPKGELNYSLLPGISIQADDNLLKISRSRNDSKSRAFHGLSRSLIYNMVEGVSNGFSKSLQIVGTGYRAQLVGDKLMLNLGFSHKVEVKPLDGISFEVPDQTNIKIIGINKQVVGQQAASIRKIRPPEPYRGKGVRYLNEHVRRKAGKAKGASGE